MRRGLAVAGTLALGLAGCGDEPGGTGAPLAPTAPAPTTAAPTAPSSSSGGGSPFVGSIAVDPADGSLLIGTGVGLYRLTPGSRRAVRLDGRLTTPDGSGRVSANLVLRFSGPGRLLASGHPKPGSALPEDLGLITSKDGGATWKPVSLLGDADLHALDVHGSVVVGQPADEARLLVSRDGGHSFQQRAAPGVALDADVDPAKPDRIVITTDEGVFVSPNAGRSWRQRDVLSGPAHLAWSHAGPLFRIEAGGAVRVSQDGGATWEERGDAGASATTMTIDRRGRLYAALPGAVIVRSSDGGRSFSQLTRLTM
jgi:hypothetical protein